MPRESKLEPLILLEDEPIPGFKEDQLGIGPFARVIAGAAAGTNGPFTIGVFANWGEGKTSLLRQAKSLIDEYEPAIVTVWFNAWQYEKEEHPIVPLVASVVRAIEEKLKAEETVGQKLAQGIRTTLSSFSRALRAIAYGFSAKTEVNVPGFAKVEAGFVAKEMIDRYDKLASTDDPLLDRTLYYNAFETLERVAAQQSSGDRAAKIVVFIDDLDRCLPPQALKLLESIKLVLAQRGFIFALAVDRRVLESFLAMRYQREYGIADYRASGTQYLDKIVQLPLSLPPHRARFAEYIEKLLYGRVFQHPSNNAVREAASELKDVLAAGSNYNPRNLVRFLNNLIVDRRIWLSVLEAQGDSNPREQLGPDRLGLCAVSRILRQHLGDALYHWLSANVEVCEKLSRNELSLSERKAETSFETLHDRSVAELLRRVDEAPFLRDLLQTQSGSSWLTDSSARQTVDEFLVERREESSVLGAGRSELESSALGGDSPMGRADAVWLLGTQWPDEVSHAILADRAVNDQSELVRRAALGVLAEQWPDERNGHLFRARARFDGAAASFVGGTQSKFGSYVFSRGGDGKFPYLDPTKPIPREHIEYAAKVASIPPHEINEAVRTLSGHMGWDITKGSATKD